MADKKISALTAATTPLAGTEVLPIVQSGSTVKVANNDLRPKQIQSNATSGVLQIAGPAAAATRVMTTPDANFTVARTDAGQTFTGNQNVTGVLAVTSTAFTGLSVTRSGAGASSAIDIIEGSGGYARIACNGGTSTLSLRPGGTETATLATDLTISSGNIIPATAAKGVNFTANTPAAGMTSQLLNWYEEGTWTPVLKFGGATTGITYTTQSGTYTRIGRMVHARATIVLSSNGSASGGAVVSGLPYTVAVTTAATIYQDGISYTGSLNVAVEGTVDRFTIQQVSEAGANSNLDRTSFSNTASFTLSVCYQV